MIEKYRFIFVYLLLTITGAYLHFHATTAVPVGRPLAEFPSAYRDWRMVSQSRFSENVLNVLKPSDYLNRYYAQPNGRNIGLYVGYHDGGKDSGNIHSPKHCLPGSGWHEISTRRMDIATSEGKVNLVKAVYQKGDNRELFFYWFQLKGETLADEYSMKLAEIANSIFHQRRDAAFIRVSVPLEGEEESAVTEGTEFIKDFYPFIRNFLPS